MHLSRPTCALLAHKALSAPPCPSATSPLPTCLLQNNFWNDVVANLSSTQVLQQLAQLANQATGVSIAGFLTGMQDPNINMNTRISWKYGCSRSVTGTPSFFVNQLPVEADATWTLAQWAQLLDPLLNNTASVKLAVARQGVQLSGFSTVQIAAVGPVGRS